MISRGDIHALLQLGSAERDTLHFYQDVKSESQGVAWGQHQLQKFLCQRLQEYESSGEC